MKRTHIIIILFIVIAGSTALAAQDFSGSLETRLGWYWTSPELVPLPFYFEGKVDGKIGNKDQPEAQYSARLRAAFDPTTAETTMDLREAWIKVFAGPFDISFGNQVIAWSCTDAFYPSDIVNPFDLTLPIDPIKIPIPLALIVFNGSNFTVDLVAQPWWFASLLPGSRWQPTASFPAGMTIVPGTTTNNLPEFAWDNVAYGGHIKASFDILQGLDLGLTFYRGRQPIPRPTVALEPTITPGEFKLNTTLDYDRFNLIAADFVLATGGNLLIKADWGYTTLRDTNPIDPEPGAATVQGVSGLEYTWDQVQLIGEYVFDWAKGAAGQDTIGHTAVAIVSWDMDSRSNLKVAGTYNFDNSGAVAPQFTYTIADGLQLNCGVFFFFGDSNTTYGIWKDNSLGRVSLKYSF